MKLVCTKPFGYRKPGDEVEVPDGAGFDPHYFAKAEDPEPPGDPAEVKSTSNAKGSK